jgi:transcriptional regulator with XRE-family HTH domain
MILALSLMTPEQSRMARAALKWSLTDLAAEAGVGRATAARFELGEPVTAETVAALRGAFEAKRVRFIDKGVFAGGVTLMKAG